jgi:pimeloyl-ACP methyl ester carboxylesterase
VTSLRHQWILDPAPGDDGAVTAMYVERRIPEQVTGACPVVLVHGGGGQGTDWGTTPDGRWGWADMLVEHGWDVHVVDRPGHGRSPGRAPAPSAAAMAARVFAPGGQPGHTQWPGPGGADDPAVRILAASASGLPADLAGAQAAEQRLLEVLLKQTGPALLVAHSLGACAAWLAAETRPDLVRAVVAVEPAGPPYLDVPGTPLRLAAGITAVRLGSGSGLTGLTKVPVSIIEGEVSPMRAACAPVAAFLRDAGVDVEHVVLPEHGLHGNGHGLPLELNNREVLDLVLSWVRARVPVSENSALPRVTGEEP